MKKKKVHVLDAIRTHEETKDMTDEELIGHARKDKGGNRIDAVKLVRAMRNKKKKAE
ncbi:MAG: hypothetical protein VX603_07055 [Gemmatimonadota bacterium]|nr:hypothetical protein [Gemmatimonadota bacterium]